MTVVCGKCRSPSLAGLCQHLPSAVSQQYLHVRGLLQSEGLYHPTECSVRACVFMCACTCVSREQYSSMEIVLTLAQLRPTYYKFQTPMNVGCIHHITQKSKPRQNPTPCRPLIVYEPNFKPWDGGVCISPVQWC